MEPSALSGLLSAGMSIASGNPIGAGLALGGTALSIFGGMGKAEASRKAFGIQQQMTQTEMQQEQVRRRAMELAARRQQIEVVRNAQRARALALNNATNQGAQQGSGLQGGYGQIAGATAWNIAGIQANLGFGREMFDLNSRLSQQKLQLAQVQGEGATSQGWMSLGSSVSGMADPLSRMTKGMSFGLSSSGSENNKWG